MPVDPTQINNTIVGNIYTNYAGKITGGILATVLLAVTAWVVANFAGLTSTNTFTASNTFSVNPQLSACVGYPYSGGATPLSCATTIPTSAVTGTFGASQMAAGSAAANLGFPPVNSNDVPVYASVPNTVSNYYTLTTVAGQTATTFANGTFTSADVGKSIWCGGIGSLEQQAYSGTISAVSSATSVSLSPAPSLTMSGVSQICMYGSDQSANLQSAFTSGANAGTGSFVPGGIYLVNTPLTCLPPTLWNNLRAPPPMCKLDQGAMIVATATMTNLMTYGSLNSNYTGYLNGAVIEGGVLNGGFNATNCAYIPFFNIITRTHQATKNCTHGVQLGDVSAPGSSGGDNDAYNYGSRDINQVPVASVTNASPPVVTTSYQHGFTTGRVVAFTNVNGQAGLSTQKFQITVTSPTSFTLNNATLSGTFTSAVVSETMPSDSLEYVVGGIATGATTTITAPSGAVANGESVFIADLDMLNAAGTGQCIDGTFTATYVSATTFTIPVNSSGCGSYIGGGTIIPAPNWTGSTNANPPVEAFIYAANSTDMQYNHDQFYGVRAGIVNNSATSGYDGKIGPGVHGYNYFQNGELLTMYYGGGDNNFVGLQTDCPARFGVWLTGVGRSTIMGSEIDCAGFAFLPNNETSFVRLEAGATVSVLGGSAKGQSGANMLGMVSGPSDPFGQFGGLPNYRQLNFNCGADDANCFLSYGQPDAGAAGAFQELNANGNATISAISTHSASQGNISVCDGTTGSYGVNMTSGAGGDANMNLLTYAAGACAYNQTLLTFGPSLVQVQQPLKAASTLAILGIPTSAGSGGLYVCVDSTGATYKKASCP